MTWRGGAQTAFKTPLAAMRPGASSGSSASCFPGGGKGHAGLG